VPDEHNTPDRSAKLAILDSPVYSIAEVSRLTKLNSNRVRRWLRGYDFVYESPRGEYAFSRSQPVVEQTSGSRYASFLDLIDIVFVKQFLDRGVSLQHVRLALAEAKEYLTRSHFAHETFFTDGRNIFLDLKEMGAHPQALMKLLSGGQWAIAPIIKRFTEVIDFDTSTGYARRWRPYRDLPVVLDPFVVFGRPTLKDRGIPTESVFEVYSAEGESVEAAMSWMRIPEEEAQGAIRFEQLLAAA